MKFRLLQLVLLPGLAALPGIAAAQAFPSKPIRLVVSTAPGGGGDVTARLLSPRLSEGLGQNVLVENRAGGSGLIAGEYVSRQPADGHTVLLDITSHAVNPALVLKMPYEPLRDLLPVTQVIRAPNVLVVHPSVPATTTAEFIAWAGAQPGGVSVASSGNGSAQHLAMEMFRQRTRLTMVHVPYKGGGPALADVVAGQVPAFFAFLSSAAPHIRAGKLRAIAVTTPQRAQAMPEVPSVAESGGALAGFEIYDFNGLFVPGGTPPEVVARIQREVARVLAMPEVRERLAAIGAEPLGSTPAEFTAFLRREIERFRVIVREAGIKAE